MAIFATNLHANRPLGFYSEIHELFKLSKEIHFHFEM